MTPSLWKTILQVFTNTKYMTITQHRYTTPGHLSQRNEGLCSHKKGEHKIFIEALFIKVNK